MAESGRYSSETARPDRRFGDPLTTTGPIRDFIRRELLYDPNAALDDDTVIFPDLVDSLGIMEVVDFLEDHFQVTIDDDELLADNFATLSAMAALVARKS